MSTEPAMVAAGEAVSAPIELRLRWSYTWEDEKADFVARDDAYPRTIGRIRREVGREEKWAWTFQAGGPGTTRTAHNGSGFAPSARAAAKAVEDTWFGFFPNGYTPSNRNSYAAASDPD